MATLKLNGYTLSDATIRAIAGPISHTIVGCSAISGSLEQEKSNTAGTGVIATSRGRGMQNGTGSITLELDSKIQLRDAFAVPSLNRIPPFTLEVVFENTEGGVAIERMFNCEFTKDGFDVATGGDVSSTSYDFIYTH